MLQRANGLRGIRSLWDEGENFGDVHQSTPLFWFTAASPWWYAAVVVVVRVITKYMYADAVNFFNPFGDRGDTTAVVRSTSDVFLSSVCSCSQRSCWPQPRGSRREAASRKDARQDLWLFFFNSRHRALLQCAFKCRESRAEEGRVPGVAEALLTGVCVRTRSDRLRVNCTVTGSRHDEREDSHKGTRRCQRARRRASPNTGNPRTGSSSTLLRRGLFRHRPRSVLRQVRGRWNAFSMAEAFARSEVVW